MKQTAIDWLYDQLEFDESVSMDDIEEVFKQAKEMEKQQELKMPDYDLDELASIFMSSGKTMGGGDSGWIKSAFKAGFQKALELLTFKSE